MANIGVTFDFAAESAKLRGEIDKVRKEVGALNGTVKGIEKGFKALGGVVAGAFSIGAIAGFAGRINAAADGLNDLAGRLGASASGLQSLHIAAGLAGGSADAVNTALGKMSTTIGDAMAGNKQAAESFTRIGLSAQQLSQLKPDEAFRLINQRLSEIPNSFERASAAQDIYGKGAKEIAGLIAEGDKAIQEVNTRLEQMGAKISDLDVAKIGYMNDELQFQQTVITNLGTKFLSGLSPAVGVATGAVAEMLGRLGGASEAGKLFGTIMVGAIKVVEVAAYGLAATFETVRAVIAGMLAVIADGIGTVLGGVASTAEFFGLQIAGPIRNAADLMDGIGQSLQDVSNKARENATQAASYAIQAATEIVKAGEIFNAAQADYEAKAAEAAARNAAMQGAGSGYQAPGSGKAPGVYDPNAARMGQGENPFEYGTLRTGGADLKDVFKDEKYLYQQELGLALDQLATAQAASQFGIAQVGHMSILDSLLLNNDMMIAAEQAKNATLGSLMGNLVQLGIDQGGAIGKASKALHIASTIWSTGAAIMQVMGPKGPGWPMNLAAAASIGAMGVKQLANIKKTNIGGGGSIAGASGGGGGGSLPSALQSTPAGTQKSTESEQRSAVTIVVQGNLIETGSTAQWLADVLGDAINGRDMVFINSNSRQAMEIAGT